MSVGTLADLWPATDLLRERARLTPGKTALVDVATGERISYGALDERAGGWATLLRRRLGLAKGERFGVLSHNAPEVIELFFAAGRAGLVIVPLNAKAPPRELATVAADCGLRALIHGPDHGGIARELVDLLESDLAVAGFGDRPSGGDVAAFEPDPPAPEQTYALLYTSGTTGRPKGVMLSHRMILANAVNTVLSWQLRDSDVSPIFTPLYHAGGLAVFLTPLVAVGGTLVLHRAFEAAEVWRTIEAEGCTVVLGVPTIYTMLLNALDDLGNAPDLSSVRWLISGGAPLPPELVGEYRRRGLTLKQGYGLTEVGVNCFFMTEQEAVDHPGSIGRPMLFTEARLVRADGSVVPEAGGEAGEVGELCLRGPHVSSGYWNRPDATADAYDEDGFFRTGDLARRDAEGRYRIAGRRKEMFVSGGANVYPAEVELALATHDAVTDVAVVGVPDAKWGEVGVAFLVFEPGAEVSDDDLKDYLRDRLTRYKVPRAFVRLEELPRTPYGKVVKGDLAELWRGRQASESESPRSIP